MECIKQKYRGDCSVASLAMFLNISYEEIIIINYKAEVDKEFKDGVWNDKTFQVSELYGKKLYCYYTDFDLTKPSLLIVPSLNYIGKEHIIYWDGKNVYDPSLSKCYSELPNNILYIFQCE